MSKPKNTVHESRSPKTSNLLRKRSQDYDPNEALRLFLWGPETTQLLTTKEESEVMVQIQVIPLFSIEGTFIDIHD